MGKIKKYIAKINNYMEAQGIKGKIPFIKVFLDIAVSDMLLGATISDYFLFRFYEKTMFARKKFMTARDKRAFYKVMNDTKAKYEVHNKDRFNEIYAEYLKRDSISIPQSSCEEFCDFIKNHSCVFIKPIELGGGDGIVKISSDTTENLPKLYESFCKKGAHVVEAGIVQHSALAAFHPQSTNSLRVTTFFDGETVKILFAGVRFGVGDSFVDNHMSGGILALIDPDTGKIMSLASSKAKLNILKHPDTGIFIPGFQIPHWDKCVQLVNEVARIVPDVHYVGWDLAILENDVCLIEGNTGGDFTTWQEPTQTGCKAETDALVKYMIEKKNQL